MAAMILVLPISKSAEPSALEMTPTSPLSCHICETPAEKNQSKSRMNRGKVWWWAWQRRSGGKGRHGSNRLPAMRLLSEAATSSGVPVYSYNEVARATNSFSHTHRLDTGAYGTVYVGRLPANSTALVAIKRLRCRHNDDGNDGSRAVALLLNEIRLISSLSHANLVRLLGCYPRPRRVDPRLRAHPQRHPPPPPPR
ncbi:wall-associated receptor kinase-like 14 [Hordeum vulgare]|nr:wall-associated receptor kinase-like 14 [Hordeum vulgare]